MFGEHRYVLRTTWTGDRGTGTSGYRDYDRAVTIEVDGKPDLLASSDKPFRTDCLMFVSLKSSRRKRPAEISPTYFAL